MSNYPAAIKAAWLVRDVEDINDTIDVAANEVGRRLNQKGKEYVEAEVDTAPYPARGGPSDSTFIATNTVLIGLLLKIKIFNADGEKYASRTAKSEVNGVFRDAPLDIVDIRRLDSDEEQ